MVTVTLEAGESSPFYDLRGFQGGRLSATYKLANGGIADLYVSNEDVPTSNGALFHESYSATSARGLPEPLPDFVQIRNSGASGTVTFAISHGTKYDGRTAPVPVG